MNIHALIQQLSATVGIPGLALNAEGMARLGIDERWTIDLEWNEVQQVLHVYALAGQLPATRREPLLIRLLAANQPGLDPAGSSFALDPETGEVLLCARVDPDTASFEHFKTVLQHKLDTLEHRVPELFAITETGQEPTPFSSQDDLKPFHFFAINLA